MSVFLFTPFCFQIEFCLTSAVILLLKSIILKFSPWGDVQLTEFFLNIYYGRNLVQPVFTMEQVS
jgi:hypothetical protein